MNKLEYECPKVKKQIDEQDECTWDSIPENIRNVINYSCSDYNLTDEEKFKLYKEALNLISIKSEVFIKDGFLYIDKDTKKIDFKLNKIYKEVWKWMR